jgi:signal transduction histidine kinase
MKSYPVFILVTILFFGLVLVWIAYSRNKEFSQHQQFIAGQATAGVADEIGRVIREKQRLVRLFSREQQGLLARLSRQTNDLQLQKQVEAKLREYFPGFFAFTLATAEGEPMLDDFDGKIGEICKQDIIAFSKSNNYLPRIHPNIDAYHFDVMTRMVDKSHVLFVSFRAGVLGEILKNVQPSNHELILVLPGAPPLIEVTATGPRITLQRNDYRMQPDELARVLRRRHVPNTSWEVLDLAALDLFGNFRRQLVFQSLLLFLPFVVFALIMLYLYRRSEQQRREAEASRDEFLSTVSHELRTPLTAIHGALGLVSSGVTGLVPDKVKELIDIAEKNSQRLILLVNDLLDMRKLESGKMPFDMQTVNLVEVIAHSIEETREFARQYEVDYEFEPEQTRILVHGDPNRLQQVMVNLLSNAAKYGQAQHRVHIDIACPDRTVRVSVSNPGSSIPPEFQPRVFDKFTQADGADSRSSRGSGLGLSIVKAIIEAHQGRIDFHSHPATGTTFYFDLPHYRDGDPSG